MEQVQIGDCTLYRADCQDVLPTLGPIDAVITDPPYGVGLGRTNNPHKKGGYGTHLGKQGYASYDDSYANFCTQIVPRLNRALDGARCAAVFSGPHLHEQRKPCSIGGIYVPRACGRTPWGSKNFLPVLFYGVPPGAGQHRPTVRMSGAHADVGPHPCAKPLAWMRWLVTLASRPGDIVCDPFMGSGTTGVACVERGRTFVGMEIEGRYFDDACTRIEAATRQGQLFPGHATPHQEDLWRH